jgi:DNA-directed RNA polymerase specialized sigma24 family protein
VEKEGFDPRLSQISTQWTLVFQAHSGPPDQVQEAQVALIDRYAGAIHRYLLGAVRDPDIARELDQEFALRFLRGDFHRADPARGRFRDFVKRSVRNLMLNYFKTQKRRPRPLDAAPEPSFEAFQTDFDLQFAASWRQGLLDRAWSALKELQDRTGMSYYTVLWCRAENPDMHSPDLATTLAAQLGKPVTANGVRQALLRSRDKFAGFLFDEVSASLEHPTPDDIEQELIDLGLIGYCRDHLKRHRAHPAGRDAE